MGAPGPYPQAPDHYPNDGVREGSGGGPVWAVISLVVYIILGGLPPYFVALLTQSTFGQMDALSWFLVIADLVPLIGAIVMLVRASNRSDRPRSERGYAYSTLFSLGGLFAMFVMVVGIVA